MKSSIFSRISISAEQVAVGALVAMVVGLFASRALLSVSIGIFFLAAPFRLGFKNWLTAASGDRFVWILGLLWLLPFLSGLWSADHDSWQDIIRIKLPLLLLPLGWVGLSIEKKSMQRIGWILVLLTLLGCFYSIMPWIADTESVRADYLRGGSLPTPLGNDRVRFSWLIVACCWWLQTQWNDVSSRTRKIIVLLCVFFLFFLHVLAVRIGLVCFYMLAGFLLIRQFTHPLHRRWSIPLFILLLSLPFILYQVLPSFRARVDYIRYDWSYTFQGRYLPGGNDAIRMQSFQAAGALIRTGSFYGEGFGDVRLAMDSVYDTYDRHLSEQERILPANEWAMHGVGLGWMGLLVFSGLIIALFFYRASDLFAWRSWILATVLSLATDIALEVQFGVFLVVFLLLFFRSVDRMKNQEICS